MRTRYPYPHAAYIPYVHHDARIRTATNICIYTYHRHYDIQGKGNAKHCQCQRHTRCRIEQTRWDWPSYPVQDPALAPPRHRQLPVKPSSSANNTGYVIFASYKSSPRNARQPATEWGKKGPTTGTTYRSGCMDR